MASVQVRILQSGRTDAYGLPLVPGSVATVDRDYAVSLTSTGFASWMNPADAFDGETNIRKPSESYTLYQSGIPFWIPPGDGGANGLSFTGTRGVFTLSAASPMANSVAFLRNCYCYLPASSGGLVAGGWFWCTMSDDTNGEIFQDTYPGSGHPAFVTSATAHPNLTAGRITQTLSPVTGASFTIPGGSLGPNGILYCNMATRFTNSGTSKYFRAVLPTGSFMYLSGTTSNGVIDGEGWLQNQGVQNRQTRVSGNTGRAHSGTTAMTSNDNSQTVQDFSVDVLFAATMQIGATTDSIIGVLREVTVKYGA